MKFPYPPTEVVCLNPAGELNSDGFLPTCSSKIFADDVSELRRKYEIPKSVEILVPAMEHAYYNPPVGYICVHEAALQCGWKLPIIRGFKNIFTQLGIGLSKVIPNSLGNLVCFSVMCKKLGVEVNYENFHHLFRCV